MRVVCKSCGYIASSIEDYFRHLEAYPECGKERPTVSEDTMKGSRPSRKERMRLAQQANQKQQEPFTRFDKQETVGQALSPNALFAKNADPDELSVARPIGFCVSPSRK